MAFNDKRVDVVVGEEEGGGEADYATAYDEDGDMGFGRHNMCGWVSNTRIFRGKKRLDHRVFGPWLLEASTSNHEIRFDGPDHDPKY